MIGRAPGPREAPLELRRYGFDRACRRSYRLPSHTHAITTDLHPLATQLLLVGDPGGDVVA